MFNNITIQAGSLSNDSIVLLHDQECKRLGQNLVGREAIANHEMTR
jgi:hypothetical protein